MDNALPRGETMSDFFLDDVEKVKRIRDYFTHITFKTEVNRKAFEVYSNREISPVDWNKQMYCMANFEETLWKILGEIKLKEME